VSWCSWKTALKIKAVLFDLGGTLVRIWIPELVYQRILASFGIGRSVDEIKTALANAEDEVSRDGRFIFGKIAFKKYWTMFDSKVLMNLNIVGSDGFASRIQTVWYDYADCEIFPEVKESLRELKCMGLKIGLVSTGYEEDIAAITGKVSLGTELFDVVVGANTIGHVKPHPNAFKYALNKLRVKPEEALFVGDSVDADYRGAKAVGMHALLVRRATNEKGRRQEPGTVSSIREILRYL